MRSVSEDRTNTGMNNMLERIGAEPYKRYRLYEKQI